MATIIRHTWIYQFVQYWQTGNNELAEVQEVVQLCIKPIDDINQQIILSIFLLFFIRLRLGCQVCTVKYKI